MKIWVDTEFDGFLGKPISFALIDENDRTFYEVVKDYASDPWVKKNVIPFLNKRIIPYKLFQLKLQEWLKCYESIEFIVDYPDDIKYLCEAFITGPGIVIEYPKDIIFRIKKEIEYVSKIPHNALEDAIAIKKADLAST